MALKSFVPGLMFYPLDIPTEGPTASTTLIDATGEAVATIFRVPLNGTLTGIAFRLDTVTTGSTISVEVQSVLSTSFVPSDALWASGTGKSFSLTTTQATTWQTVALSAAAQVSVGDVIALVVKRANVGGGGAFRVANINTTGLFNGFPQATKTLAWAKSNTRVNCMYPIFSATAVPAFADYAPFYTNTQVLSAGAADDEVGMVINLPFQARLHGWYVNLIRSLGSVVKVRMYDTNGTTIMSESQILHDAALGLCQTGVFPSSTVLAADSNYRLAVFVSTGAATIYAYSLDTTSSMGTLHGGSLCVATKRVDAGAWSNNTLQRYSMGISFQQFDDSSASGGAAGGLAHIIGGP